MPKRKTRRNTQRVQPLKRYLYHVLRHTEDPDLKDHYTEFQGSYRTLEEANEAVRHDLDEWDRDFFDDYEEEVKSDGTVTITGYCPEGEVMTVYIEKIEEPPDPECHCRTDGKGDSKKLMLKIFRPSSAQSTIYVVMQTVYRHREDEQGRTSLALETAFESLAAANRAAYEGLRGICGLNDTNSEDADESSGFGKFEAKEFNRNSETEPYKATVYVQQDDRDRVDIEVVRMTLERAVARPEGSRKRPRVEMDESDPDKASE